MPTTCRPVLAALLLLLALPALADTADPEATDRAAIATAAKAFSAAYMAGDAAGLADSYTEDALLLPPNGRVSGRAAAAKYFRARPGRTNLHHETRSASLELQGDLAIDTGTWHYRWQLDGGAPQEASGGYLAVWERGADGKWRMAYDMWHRPAD